jgi:hypothetical protein
MQLKTIFNHVVDYKPFVVDKVEFIGEEKRCQDPFFDRRKRIQ